MFLNKKFYIKVKNYSSLEILLSTFQKISGPGTSLTLASLDFIIELRMEEDKGCFCSPLLLLLRPTTRDTWSQTR